MSEQEISRPSRFRILRRIFTFIFLFIGLVVLIGGIGVVGVWSHFWGFNIGNPSSDSCASCHVMETYESSLNQPEMLVSLHSDKEVGCVDCHSMSFEQQLHETVAYLQDDYTQPFTRAEYGMETCFQCHEHGSYDQIAWRTTDLGVTDGKTKGHEANPHQSPHYDDLECNTCHRMHRESVLFCSECHAFEFRIPVPVPSDSIDSTDSTDSTDEPADDSVVEDSTETP